MKKLLGILFVTMILLFSSCASIDKALLNPVEYEIQYEIQGTVKCSVYADHYEVSNSKAGEIIKKQAPTGTSLYLYEKDGETYWKILRESDETAETIFMPKRIEFKVEFSEKKISSNGYETIHYKGRDINTGVKYHLMELPWKTFRGKYYFLGIIDGDKQVVYSMENYNISWR